ncbi:hypothetical protein Leryth_021170 [Lithospermum erythrorhizon]|nr:hypothetical protein Leryth_021170 [Lithospermum erythrorhizon]
MANKYCILGFCSSRESGHWCRIWCNRWYFRWASLRLMASFVMLASYTDPDSFSSANTFSEAFGKFYGQSKNGSSNDETSKGHGVHNNCINSEGMNYATFHSGLGFKHFMNFV